ncbi:hypothetical protein BRD13_03645 [Halobacteriales archaeon SW_5_70_135]|nr:MAG: hypothetical protein BRD13_03645 [Halobacteriales archaeon SW_5_70_135]
MTDDDARSSGAETGAAPRETTAPPEPVGEPRDALAWGAVGSLAFLVLHQAYLLAGGRFLGVGAVAGVALSVGLVVGGAGLWLAGRANGNGQG